MGVMAQKANETFQESTKKFNTSLAKENSYIYPFNTGCATIDSAKLYQVEAGGYITGHNGYGDQGYAQLYNLGSSRQIKGIGVFMLNASGSPVSVQLPAKLMSADFSSVLAQGTYDPSTITSGITDIMFSSPVSASNFAAAVEIGEFNTVIVGTDTTYNLLVIAQTPMGCASGDNAYSYSLGQDGTTLSWVSMKTAYQQTTDFLDLFIFPIVEGAGLNSNIDVNTLTYVYPNPAKDQVILASSFNMNKVEIFNMIGQKVYENTVNGITSTVNVAGFTPGTYMVKMYTEGGLATKKIVVE